MAAWIHLFSQFTAEALLGEALLIFLLLCFYTSFWILKKRRYGVIENDMPSGPVKNYLNALVSSADQLRIQLFGLLSAENLASSQGSDLLQSLAKPTQKESNVSKMASPSVEGTQKIATLEAQLAEQTRALTAMTLAKEKLERETAELGAKLPATSGAQAGNNNELQKKIQELEARLAEYSVIEDDLANLKRLQQENAQLREAASGKAQASSAAPAVPPVAETPVVQVAAPVQTPAPQASAPAAQPQPAAAASPASTEGGAVAPPAASENPEADLVAEFEKMLKG